MKRSRRQKTRRLKRSKRSKSVRRTRTLRKLRTRFTGHGFSGKGSHDKAQRFFGEQVPQQKGSFSKVKQFFFGK